MNINTIAKMAGVSTATVSRYLNQGYVSEEKRQRIQETIDKTGYVPSNGVQPLRITHSRLVGVIVPKISSESVSRMVDGITEVVNHASYQLLLGDTENTTELELEYLKLFRNSTVDGVIFIGTHLSKKHLSIIHSYQKPIVLLGQQEAGLSCAYFDDYGAAEKATECLIRNGCQKIAHLGVTLRDKETGRARRSGFMDTLERHHLPCTDEYILECDGFSSHAGEERMQKFLSEGLPFDGLFCATDSLAFGAMDCMRCAGIHVPGQVRVASVGNNRMTTVYSPHLTSVSLSHRTGGIEAGNLLMEQLQSPHKFVRSAQMQSCLYERESSSAEEEFSLDGDPYAYYGGV